MKQIIRKLIAWAYPDAAKFMASIEADCVKGKTFLLDANLFVKGSLSTRGRSYYPSATERGDKTLELNSGKS